MSESDLTNQQKLEEIYRLTVENNHMLHNMRNRERVANAFRILYWVVIIGSLLGAYYYIKPVLEIFMVNKDKITQTLNQFDQLQQQFPETRILQQVLSKLKGGSATPEATSTVTP
jgi:hypothetical protein